MVTKVLQGVVIALPERVLLSQLAFASRFTPEEQVALELLMETHPDPEVRATLRAIDKQLMRSKNGVDPEDLRTIGGATITVDAFVAAGVVAPESRDARLAAILAPLPS